MMTNLFQNWLGRPTLIAAEDTWSLLALLLVSVAMCGWNADQATNGGNLPQSMCVDYVRVYQKRK